jgi:hypothetical protein
VYIALDSIGELDAADCVWQFFLGEQPRIGRTPEAVRLKRDQLKIPNSAARPGGAPGSLPWFRYSRSVVRMSWT